MNLINMQLCFLLFPQGITERAFDIVYFGCVFGGGETPVTIPNTEVKLTSGNGTAALAVGE